LADLALPFAARAFRVKDCSDTVRGILSANSCGRCSFPPSADKKSLCFLPTLLRSPTLPELALGGFMVAIAVRSADFHLGLVLVMAFSIWIWPAAGWAYTADEQAACTDDAFRLCSAEIPDVDRVTACMVGQQSQLSPGCRVYFRPDPPAAPAASGKPVSIKPVSTRKPRKSKKPPSKKPA